MNNPIRRFPEFSEKWNYSYIKDEFVMSSGQTPSTSNPKYFENGYINWINSGELTSKYIGSTSNKITDLAKKDCHLKEYDEGTFVMAIYGLEADGVRGKCSILKEKATISQSCMALEERGNIKSEFFYYYYQYKSNEICLKIAQGTKQQNLNSNLLGNVKIPKCDVNEQSKIIKLFSKIDNLIESAKDERDTLLNEKKSFAKSFFEQKIKYEGETTPHKLKDALIEYNEKWVNDGKYEHVSLTKEGVIPKTDRYDRDALVVDEEKQYKITHINDICYNPANLKFGVIARNKYKDAIFSPIYVTFKVNEEIAMPEFIEFFVTRPDFYKKALKYQQGTVYERMAVSPEDLLKMEIKLPSLNEQKKIVNILSSYSSLIEIKQKQLDTLKNIKKGFLQQMFPKD